MEIIRQNIATEKSAFRYVYVKPRSAVKEFEAIRAMGLKVQDGGPEAYIANFLQVAGDAPVLIVSYNSTPQIPQRVLRDNIEVRWIYWRRSVSMKTLVSRIIASLKLVLMIVRFRPTHILSWSRGFILWASYAAAVITRAVFVTSRHTRFPNASDPWHRRIIGKVDKWVTLKSKAIVCHGPYLKQETLALGAKPSKVIEFNWGFQHLLDKTGSAEQVTDLTNGGKLTLILFIGRIFLLKGVFDLLEACADRLRKDPNLRLVYAGDGPALTRLRRHTEELHLMGKVVFLGRVLHVRLAGVIRQSKLLVTPTQSVFPEGRCMAVMEGLMLGVPVIAPDFGPFQYLIQNKINGLLYKPDCIDDLRLKINEVLDNTIFYNKLRKGSKESGAKLRNPPVNFMQAVEAAFHDRTYLKTEKMHRRFKQ